MTTADDDSRAKPKPEAQGARAVGRGGLAVLGAKVYFILISFVQQSALKVAIGMAGYGALSRVLALSNIVNNVIVSSSTQGVSRAVAGGGERREEAFRATLRVHVPLALGLAVLFALVSPAYAAFEKSPHIVRPLRIAALVVAIYGVYAPLVGALNGRALFTRQAALDTIFATLRTLGLIGVGWFFARRFDAGAEGAIIGFALAAAIIVVPALAWSGTGRARDAREGDAPEVPRPGAYLAQLLPLALAQLFANGLMQADIAVLGRFLSSGALESGLMGDAASKSADEWVAVYRFCQFFAFLPYQLVLSIAQILFPMVAKAHAEQDGEAVRRYVGRGARISAIACGLFVTVLTALPASVLGMAFGASVAARGAATLRVLILGQGAFTLFGIGATVLASLGKEKLSAALSLVLLLLMTGAVWAASSQAPYGEPQLRATALATSVTLGVGLLGMSLAVRRFAQSFIPLATFARVAAAVALASLAGLALPRFGWLLAPFVALAVGIAYFVFLAVTGELKAADRAMFASLLGRKGRKG